ncbi:MAG: helix-turn-helix transcriptional regulator [Defluviitaleaceae bacterium]|nr:helix-turn-helix transcriptional regulator [Defluviitaleaceae bacterium]
MTEITVLNVAHHKRETDFYRADNPTGLGADIYLFIHFLSPAIVITDGIEHKTAKGACIIYTPGQRQEYRHHDGVFVNDFLIYKVDDPHFTARYALPENELFYISNSDEITRQLEIITYTMTDRLIDRREETTQHVLKLFETLSNLYVENKPGSKRMFEVKQRFIMLRDEMRTNPKDWTVDKMAKQVWFTRSRFSVLYNEFFKISPNADLVNIKIKHAKKLLKTTDMTVADISVACGYSSVEHFIRIFNKQVRSTPLQYRKIEKRTIQ